MKLALPRFRYVDKMHWAHVYVDINDGLRLQLSQAMAGRLDTLCYMDFISLDRQRFLYVQFSAYFELFSSTSRLAWEKPFAMHYSTKLRLQNCDLTTCCFLQPRMTVT